MRPLLGLCAVSLVIAAGCVSSLPTSRDIGVINVQDTAATAGGYLAASSGIFWNSKGVKLPDSHPPRPDSCWDSVTTIVGPGRYTNQLDAGDSISYTTGTGASAPVDVMRPDTVPTFGITYRNHDAGLPHTPGADIIFDIPGAPNGMVSSTFRVHTPRSIWVAPIDEVGVTSLDVKWTTGTVGQTAVLLQFVMEPPTLNLTGKSIFCDLNDVGEVLLEKHFTDEWIAAKGNPDTRLVEAIRWETTFLPASNDALLTGIAQVDTIKTTFP